MDDLDAFKKQQESTIKINREKNNEFINSTMDVISEEVNKGIKVFEDQLNKALDDIKNDYQKNKKKIIEKIIKEFGFDF